MRFLNRLQTQGRAVLRRALLAAFGPRVLRAVGRRLLAVARGRAGAARGAASMRASTASAPRTGWRWTRSRSKAATARARNRSSPRSMSNKACRCWTSIWRRRRRGSRTLPWVRSAEIERRMPDTLYIKIEERRPFAFWQKNGKLMLIDRDGMVIPAGDLSSYGPLIVLVGDDAPGNAVPLLDMLKTEPALAARVRAGVRLGRAALDPALRQRRRGGVARDRRASGVAPPGRARSLRPRARARHIR